MADRVVPDGGAAGGDVTIQGSRMRMEEEAMRQRFYLLICNRLASALGHLLS